jgi:hypothetical protein
LTRREQRRADALGVYVTVYALSSNHNSHTVAYHTPQEFLHGVA